HPLIRNNLRCFEMREYSREFIERFIKEARQKGERWPEYELALANAINHPAADGSLYFLEVREALTLSSEIPKLILDRLARALDSNPRLLEPFAKLLCRAASDL